MASTRTSHLKLNTWIGRDGLIREEMNENFIKIDTVVKDLETKSESGTGQQGIPGVKGDKGDAGEPGIQGLKGDKGDPGVQGERGLQGEKGDKGDTGLQGERGIQGLKGETGAQGQVGAKGDQGLPGSKGETGSQGIQGVQGAKGDTGDTGLQGLTGLTGAKGDTGERGIQGIQGIKGDTGAQLYTWIKYATSATGTGISDSPVGMSYLGIATNKASATKSTVASDYTWSLIKDTGITQIETRTSDPTSPAVGQIWFRSDL